MVSEYLTVAQAARQRGTTRQTIYDAIKSGRLPAIELLGRVAVKAKDVEALTILTNDQRQGIHVNTVYRKRGRGRPRKVKEGDTHA